MAPTDDRHSPEIPDEFQAPDGSRLRRRLARLPRESPLPEGAEDRLVTALRREDLLRAPAARRVVPRRWLLAALVPLAFAAGLWVASFGSVPAPEPSHVLLLHTSLRETAPDQTPEQRRAVFEEHAAWARRLDAERRLVDAQPIALDGWRIEGPGATVSELPSRRALGVSGYYLIRAASDREALDLARSCPHLRQGGTVEVRRVGSSG